MTENKRFVDYFDKDHNYIIQDLIKETEYQVGFVNCDEDLFLELINEIAEENEHLKIQLQNTSDQRNEFHRGARENANRIRELEKKNEQLVKMLNNAANYVQREHKEIPLDDFVEWWNNMVTEGLDD